MEFPGLASQDHFHATCDGVGGVEGPPSPPVVGIRVAPGLFIINACIPLSRKYSPMASGIGADSASAASCRTGA
ncbi:hypothetical protein TSUD_370640 [Trifolium subterraneum]|uniref:Uncharacterized protein n=1 Tax=Trifolium subterraneum TaxID=3900 RepID=A0A2Z6NJV0_TRISU|nr:hypothetical protein TSUD_370640 [Trifolium subterraneum]